MFKLFLNVVIVFFIFFVEVACVNCIKLIYDDDTMMSYRDNHNTVDVVVTYHHAIFRII